MDHNGNKATQLFVLCLPSHLTAITTILNFNEFIFVYIMNIRFICDGEIYLLTYLLTIIEETWCFTNASQIPSPMIIRETPITQMLQTKDINNSKNESPTTIVTQPPPKTTYPTTELTINEFPTLPTKSPSTHSTDNIKDREFSANSVEQSPAIISKQSIQIVFKQPLQTTSDSEDCSTINMLTRDQQSAFKQVCRELHKYNF